MALSHQSMKIPSCSLCHLRFLFGSFLGKVVTRVVGCVEFFSDWVLMVVIFVMGMYF